MAASASFFLAGLTDNDFTGSICLRRYLPKLISDRLQRQHNSLMTYNIIEGALEITKLMYNYYNHFTLERKSKV